MKTWKNWIDGQWVASASREMTAIENPATGEKIGDAPNSNRCGLDQRSYTDCLGNAAWRLQTVRLRQGSFPRGCEEL
jgi:acyl-CoA reductase-like NAD-dependent aldehyde dehydrogenase